MADFILLPPRPLVGEQIAYLLRPYLPGIPVTSMDGAKILEELSYAGGDDAYIVFREDLGESDDIPTSLRDGFGAEDGDRIIHIALGPAPEEPRISITNLDAAPPISYRRAA
jgi:hypothetical protein